MAGDTMRIPLTTLMLAVVMAACSHGPTLSTQERLALYREHAGAPVNSFRLDRVGGMQSWTPLGDQALVIWSSSNRGHLLDLRARCPAMLTSPRVSLTNSFGQVVSRMDSVVVRNAPGTTVSVCRISTIRPIDGRSLRDAKRELREAELIDRSTAPPEESPAPEGT